jgi:hypothetical protein
VIIKRYSKGKMSSRAVHKMQREVSGHCHTLLAPGCAAGTCVAAARVCLLPCLDHRTVLQIKLMYHLRGQAGVAQILGDFADAAHFYIAMVWPLSSPVSTASPASPARQLRQRCRAARLPLSCLQPHLNCR